jgi:hypothetical protein
MCPPWKCSTSLFLQAFRLMFSVFEPPPRSLPSERWSMRPLRTICLLCTRTTGLLLVCSTMLATCGSPANLPPSGTVSLEYIETSGDRAVFQLENHSTQTLYFRGHSTPLTGVAPLAGAASTLECRPVESWAWVAEGKIQEGGPETVRVAPGQRQRLNVEATFVQQHKAGRCRLRLRLEGDTFIESKSFTP